MRRNSLAYLGYFSKTQSLGKKKKKERYSQIQYLKKIRWCSWPGSVAWFIVNYCTLAVTDGTSSRVQLHVVRQHLCQGAAANPLFVLQAVVWRAGNVPCQSWLINLSVQGFPLGVIPKVLLCTFVAMAMIKGYSSLLPFYSSYFSREK